MKREYIPSSSLAFSLSCLFFQQKAFHQWRQKNHEWEAEWEEWWRDCMGVVKEGSASAMRVVWINGGGTDYGDPNLGLNFFKSLHKFHAVICNNSINKLKQTLHKHNIEFFLSTFEFPPHVSWATSVVLESTMPDGMSTEQLVPGYRTFPPLITVIITVCSQVRTKDLDQIQLIDLDPKVSLISSNPWSWINYTSNIICTEPRCPWSTTTWLWKAWACTTLLCGMCKVRPYPNSSFLFF